MKPLLSRSKVVVAGCLLASALYSLIGCGSSESSKIAAPVISPAGGTFTAPTTVSISAAGFGTTIYYTTDGTLPTTASNVYGGPITLTSSGQTSYGPFTIYQNTTVQAIAVGTLGYSQSGVGYNQSAVASATFTLNLPAAPAPSISPAAGTYSAASVTITDSLVLPTGCATSPSIYYTTDGSTPTTASNPYKGPISLNSNATVKAIAIDLLCGYSASAVASSSYVITAATPTISPAAGLYTTAQTVTIADVDTLFGAVLYYTLDGSMPTTSSAVYSAPIAVSQSETVKAIAAGPNFAASALASAAYVIQYPAATPVISPAQSSTVYNSAQTVTITDSTPGAVIHYTITSGTAAPSSPPTSSSPTYTGPITVAQSETVQAIAVASGYSASNVASVLYTLNIPTVPAPAFSPAPAAGTIYNTPKSVTISDSLAGSTIYYTTSSGNGTPPAPTTSSTLYTGPITVSSNETISAIAVETGYNQSPVVTQTYYISTTTSNLNGTVTSGSVPIYNATVNLYAAGTKGYGSAGTLLATTTTNAGGNFQFTQYANGIPSSGNIWSCPMSDPNPDPQIYITAVGGNTQGTGTSSTNNSAAGFIAAIGPCSTVSTLTNVTMNEVTTVATVFALAQYINPGSGPGAESIGTNGANLASNPPQGAIGLNNAVAGIVNLANIATGAGVTANAYTGAAGSNVANVTVTATPESAKIVTVANVLASCVNSTASSSAQCADLFANASPPPNASATSQPSASFAAAQDTIQAAYYMAVNPIDAGSFTNCATSGATTKLGCLFGLASTKPTYPSGLTAAPTDWTLGVSYSAYASGTTTTLGTSTGASVSPYNCNAGHYFLYGPQRSAVDAYGNLWFINSIYHTDNVSAISPIGQPLYCATTVDPGSPFSAGITIDTAGSVWVEMSGQTANTPEVFKIPSPGATPTNTSSQGSLTAFGGLAAAGLSTGIVADGYGNVFYSSYASATGTSVYEIVAGATSGSFLVGSNANVTSSTEYAFGAVDSVGRVYFGANSSGSAASLEATPPSANLSGYSINGGTITFTTVNSPSFSVGQSVIVSGLTSADGLALDRQQLTVTGVAANSFTASTSLPATSASVADSGIAVVVPMGAASYSVIANSFGINTYGQALDSNNYLYAGTTCCGSTPEETLLKVTVNPAGTAIVSASGNYTFSPQNIGGATGIRSVALDGADNVWFGNEYASNDGGSSGSNENQNAGIWSVGEASTSGGGSTATFTALSPAATGLANGDSCATGTGCPVGGGFQKTSLGYTFGLSIDPSGNVWAPNFTAPASVPINGYGNANIVEIVGAAVPVVTPLSVAAANGTLATKP